MKQSEFEKKYDSFWSELENMLLADDKSTLNKRLQINDSIRLKKQHSQVAAADENFPENYRLLCHHLSLSRSRHYSPLLVERLEKLVINAHQIFYKRKTHMLVAVLIYFTSGFSQSVRKEWRWVLLSSVLFFGTFFGMLVTLQYYPDMVYTVISGEQLAQMESMYDPSQDKIGRDRNSGSDFEMFGFYIFNNTGIGLRTFASGLVFGIGSLLTLVFNGLTIGGVAGYLTYIGYSSTFWPFVSGHSAMELTAIVLSGAAGFKLGFSIISPGRKSRIRSLIDSAREAVYMMYGVAIMFIIAAFIEAYWSSMTDIPSVVKYTVGIINWVVLIAYFMLLGRQRAIR
ncbi:MAG: stage II sporulation protein M [Gammaproteobacteria bacterium]|nr:stage II sporulation protein M [Gammaproteobacteria bacterium]